MKFEPSASSALWPPISRSRLAPSAGPNPLRIGEICVYVRKASADVRRAQIDPRDEASTTLVGITYNWWRRQACLPFGPNQSKTLFASFALDLAAMDGSLARDAAQAVRVPVIVGNSIRLSRKERPRLILWTAPPPGRNWP